MPTRFIDSPVITLDDIRRLTDLKQTKTQLERCRGWLRRMRWGMTKLAPYLQHMDGCPAKMNPDGECLCGLNGYLAEMVRPPQGVEIKVPSFPVRDMLQGRKTITDEDRDYGHHG